MIGVDDIEQIGVSAKHRGPAAPPYEPPIEVRGLPLPRRLLYETWHSLRWPDVEHATGYVDVIHATGLAVPPASAPLVVTVHDLAWERWPEFFTRNGVRFFRQHIDLTRRYKALVVCPSEATARDAVAARIDQERIRVVPWGVDQTEASDEEVDRVRRDRALDRPYILSVGTNEPRKNLGVVLDAFTRLGRADLDLVVVGASGWKEAGLDEDRPGVRPLGFVPDSDLRALYAGAEAFVYPTLLEGFGLPVLEAMIQGTPVVTSAGTATEEVLGAGGVAVESTVVDAVVAGLEQVLGDRVPYAEAARARARTFTWRRTADALAAVYREAAA